MPAGTNFKLRADIGPYKQSMNEAKAATKTLDAEMKLAQTQFKATGDAENYLQQRTKILAQQIAQQEKAATSARDAMAKMAQNGVKESDVEFQRLNRSALEAEERLANLRIEAEKTGDELLKTSQDAGTMGDSLSSIDKGMHFQNIMSGIRGITTVISQVADKVQQFVDMVIEAGKWADDLATRSISYGIDEETLQRWEYASNLIDTDVSAILKARDRLTQATRKDDYIAIVDGIKGYAVALKEADGTARNSMDVFWDFIDVLNQMEDATSQDQLAQEYFGKSFRDLEPLIKAGRGEWERLSAEADVVSKENVDALTTMDDSLQKLNSKWETFKRSLAGEIAPAFTNAINNLSRAVDTLLENIETIASVIERGLYYLGFTDEHPDIAAANRENRKIQSELEREGQNVPPVDAVYAYNPKTGEWSIVEQAAQQAGTDAGVTAAESFANGAASAAEQAYAAGAAVGAAAAAGAASAAGGNTTNNSTTQNFGDTYNYYSNGYEGYTEEQQRQLAGYGG